MNYKLIKMQKPKIIYFFDTLCGWCYGFSPVIKQIAEKYGDHFEFEVISGGMVTGERVQPASVMANYILGAYKQVETMTSVTFGEPYLEMLREGTRIQSSFEPALVMRTFKTFLPEKAVFFAHDLQKANYYDGLDLNDFSNYQSLVEKYDLDWAAFFEKMETQAMQKATIQDFQIANAYEVTGFPTVFFENETVRSPLSRGFQSFENLDNIMQQVMEDQQK
jgi:putative protein-disulfide isomerase